MDPEGMIGFLREAGKLKRINRTGWVESGVEDPESVADHSYRVALLAMLLADAEGADALKAVRMALLHDLPEARTGDLTPRMKEQKPGWEREERQAADSILGTLPEQMKATYSGALAEYEEGASREARIARAADKLEMLLQSVEYTEAGSDPRSLMRFRHVAFEGGLAARLAAIIKDPEKVKQS